MNLIFTVRKKDMPAIPRITRLLTHLGEENYKTCYCKNFEEIDEILTLIIDYNRQLFHPILPRPIQIYIGHEGICYSLVVSTSFGLNVPSGFVIAFHIKLRELVVFGEHYVIEEHTINTFSDTVKQVVRDLIRIPHSSDFYL